MAQAPFTAQRLSRISFNLKGYRRYRHKNRRDRNSLKTKQDGKRTRQNQRQIGAFYEEKAARFLESKGLFLVARNYRCPMGEVDLIARDGRFLVFVEVKYRKSQKAGGALPAVDARKRRTIAKVASHYLLTHGGRLDVSCRFDVIGFDGEALTWIPNAFEAGI